MSEGQRLRLIAVTWRSVGRRTRRLQKLLLERNEVLGECRPAGPLLRELTRPRRDGNERRRIPKLDREIAGIGVVVEVHDHLLFDRIDDRCRPAPDRPSVQVTGPPVIPGRDRDPESGHEPADRYAALDPDQLERFVLG